MAGLSLFEKLLVFYGAVLPGHPGKWLVHDRLRRLLKVTLDEELDVVRKGLKWRLNPADYTDSSLFWLNCRDDWDLIHLKRLLSPGATVIDAGANFGYYSLILAKELNRQCRIFACEPDPLNFERLKKHVKNNELTACIQLVPMGLSDREEKVRMWRPQENSGHSTVDADGAYGDVLLTTLPALCKNLGIDSLDLLIVDVEGYEQRVLQGAGEVLSRLSPVVFVELFPPVMRRHGATPEAVVGFLEAQGYRLFVALKDRLIPLVTPPSGEVGVNVFAFHEKHFARGLARSV